MIDLPAKLRIFGLDYFALTAKLKTFCSRGGKVWIRFEGHWHEVTPQGLARAWARTLAGEETRVSAFVIQQPAQVPATPAPPPKKGTP